MTIKDKFLSRHGPHLNVFNDFCDYFPVSIIVDKIQTFVSLISVSTVQNYC